MRKRWQRWMTARVRRAAGRPVEMREEELALALRGKRETPEILGVLELARRLEERLLSEVAPMGVAQQEKVEGLAAIEALRELRAQVEVWTERRMEG